MQKGKISISAIVLILFLLGGLGIQKSGIAGGGGGGSSLFGEEKPSLIENGSGTDGEIACKIGGCNGELCVRQGVSVNSACSWQPSFACYSPEFTECIQISETECGWRQTQGLQSCLQGAYEGVKNPSAVTNYVECVSAGNTPTETYPAKCRHNGQTFIEQI